MKYKEKEFLTLGSVNTLATRHL